MPAVMAAVRAMEVKRVLSMLLRVVSGVGGVFGTKVRLNESEF